MESLTRFTELYSKECLLLKCGLDGYQIQPKVNVATAAQFETIDRSVQKLDTKRAVIERRLTGNEDLYSTFIKATETHTACMKQVRELFPEQYSHYPDIRILDEITNILYQNIFKDNALYNPKRALHNCQNFRKQCKTLAAKNTLSPSESAILKRINRCLSLIKRKVTPYQAQTLYPSIQLSQLNKVSVAVNDKSPATNEQPRKKELTLTALHELVETGTSIGEEFARVRPSREWDKLVGIIFSQTREIFQELESSFESVKQQYELSLLDDEQQTLQKIDEQLEKLSSHHAHPYSYNESFIGDFYYFCPEQSNCYSRFLLWALKYRCDSPTLSKESIEPLRLMHEQLIKNPYLSKDSRFKDTVNNLEEAKKLLGLVTQAS